MKKVKVEERKQTTTKKSGAQLHQASEQLELEPWFSATQHCAKQLSWNASEEKGAGALSLGNSAARAPPSD